MTSVSDNLLERFQSDRSEYFSPPICEILREYEAWRSEASNDLVGEMEKALERAHTIVLEQRCERGTPWDLACVTIAEKVREHVNATLSRMRDARNGGGGQSVGASSGSHASTEPVARLRPSGFDPARWQVQPAYRNGRAVGWQVWFDDRPISGLFDHLNDAAAALNEFRAEYTGDK